MSEAFERGDSFGHIHVQVRGKTRGRIGYHTFQSISVKRQINALAATFRVRFPNKWLLTQDEFDLDVFRSCRITRVVKRDDQGRILRTETLLDGFIESLNTAVDDSSHTIEISGRDKTGDLIDCSPPNLPEFNNLTLYQIMVEVCKPFNIQVSGSRVDDYIFPKAKLRPGETVFAFLNRLSKQRGLLLCNRPRTGGGIELCVPGARRYARSKIDSDNVLSFSLAMDSSKVFSEYTVLSQSNMISSLSLESDEVEAQQEVNATHKDNSVKRYRPLTFIAEKSSNNTQALSRARWEASKRSAQLLRINVTVIGWINADNQIWKENHRVNVDYPASGIKGEYLISECSYSYGADDSQKTTMTLVNKNAFQVQKVIPQAAEVSGGLNFKWTKEDFVNFHKKKPVDYKPQSNTGNIGAKE